MARILIVEDEMLIAWMLTDWLTELGHVTIGPAASIDAALALIAAEPVDAAIVDLHLGGASAKPVAAGLLARKIPFAIASGDSTAATHFAGCPALAKPYSFDDIQRAIATMVGGA
jgi:DNA-binding response OmpR family regulator